MKKILENTKFITMVFVISVLMVVIVTIQITLAKSRLDNVENTMQVLTESVVSETENTVYTELIQEEAFEQSVEVSETNKTIIEIKSFISEYDAALELNTSMYPKYKEKQRYIENSLEKYFTDKAWKKTRYFVQSTQDEFTVLEDGIRLNNPIFNQSRDVLRMYFRDTDENSAEVFLNMRNTTGGKNTVEYELLKVKKIDGEWKIVNYFAKEE